jgi:hypothetical protein
MGGLSLYFYKCTLTNRILEKIYKTKRQLHSPPTITNIPANAYSIMIFVRFTDDSSLPRL